MVSPKPRRNPISPGLYLLLSLVLAFLPTTVPAQYDLGERPGRSDQETIALPPDDDEICDDVEEGGEDYSDGSILTCSITSATADTTSQTLLIEGAFCDSPAVSIGGPGGTLDLVTVFSSGPSFIQADLSGHASPATRVVLVECPCESCEIDVTVGAAGPPGPTGPTGPTDPGAAEQLAALTAALCQGFFNTLGEEFCGTCLDEDDCDDIDECTVDVCEDSGTADAVCSNTVLPDGTICAGVGQCVGGVCTARYAFVTSVGYAPDFGGIAAADAICNQHAAGKLPGVYKAWLSDDTDSPSTTFVQHTGPYVRVDGVQIASGWTDLTDGSIDAPLNVRENGTDAGVGSAWTGTLPDGTAVGHSNCIEWTSNADGDEGHGGRVIETDHRWTDFFTGFNCANFSLPLYCFQQ